MQQNCALMSVLLMIADGFIVHGPSGPLVAPLGTSVVLPCYVDEPLLTEYLEVEWRRTDSQTLVHLYQDGESRPESQQQDYQDRAHFFTEHIKDGNFSIRLDSLRAQDEGQYTCNVYNQQKSGEAVVEIKVDNFEHLLVSGSDRYISASVGKDVTLNCSVDSHIPPEDFEQVSWKKTNEDEEIMVLLYQNNEAFPDSSHDRFRDRVEFFTSEIPKGNFSVRLKSVRTEDKGVYMCQVFAGGASANATVVLERLGFSVTHIIMFILCVSASGSALLLFCLIYCRSPNKGFFVRYICKLSVPLGGSVVLPCHVDKHSLKKSLKVEWRRTDSKTLVNLYQDGESRAEKQPQDYQDRAHLCTGETKHGNFSLRLDNLRAEDEGQYICKVFSDKACVFSANTEVVTGFNVKCSCHTLAPLGSSVVLPCYIGKPLPVESLKVEWRRTDSDTDADADAHSETDSKTATLVHLYQDGESQPQVQHQDYQDRAHFFTEHIKDGNFSLCMDNLRAEDEGVYTCKVYSDQRLVFSVKTSLTLRMLDAVFHLQMCLVFCPNILMFLAFVFWGISEGSLFETVSCCSLYSLRPLMLLWAAPYVNEFTGKNKTWVLYYSYLTEYIVFVVVFYSALFKSALDKSLNYAGFEVVMIIVLFAIALVINLFYIILLLARLIWEVSRWIISIFRVLAGLSFNILPSLQFIILSYAYGSTRGGFFVVAILPLFLIVTRFDWDVVCGQKMGCSPLLRRSVWLILMLLMNAVIVYFYIKSLENEKGCFGWACMIASLQLLWAVTNFTYTFKWDLPRAVPVYVFGSVCVVLLNAVALMTELILKTVNGEGKVGDLRVVIFSSEFLFTLFLMVLLVFEPWIKPCLQSYQKARQTPAAGSQNQESQNAAGSDETPASGSNQSQSPAESLEMKPLLKHDQETGKKETQLDSVLSQT